MLFESNVFNLIDWSVNGVEPRTGMYLRTLPVASVVGNYLQGPALDLAIRFNPFSNLDDGFGTGWELTLPRIEVSGSDKILVLADGSRYRILDESGEDDIQLQYKRSNTFRVTKDPASPGGYIVIHKDGRRETLSNNRTSLITTPDLRTLSLAWHSDQTFTLTDDKQTTLLSTRWDGDAHCVTTPRGVFAFLLNKSNPSCPFLEKVSSRNGSTDSDLYLFTYTSTNTSYLLISHYSAMVNFFQSDDIVYGKLATPPGMPGEVHAVKSIQQYVKTKNGVNEYLTTSYTYFVSNYLGYPAVTSWAEKMDNLESLPYRFTFGTVEHIGTSKTTQRRYDKFYLLANDIPLDKKITPADNTQAQGFQYDYQLVTTGKIDDQVSTYMLPTVEKHTYSTLSPTAGSLKRTTTRTFEYDDYANLTRMKGEDGIEHEYVYYPASGESSGDSILCPADPDGFVRHLKSLTLRPDIPSSHLPDRTHRYQYKTLAGTRAIVMTEDIFQETFPDTATPAPTLLRTRYTYDETSGSLFLACLLTQEQNKPAVSADPQGQPVITDYLTTQSFSYKLSEDKTQLTTLNTLHGFDGSQKTGGEVFNTATGDLCQATDENGLVSSYQHDALGRLIETRYAWSPSPTGQAIDSTSHDPVNSKVTRSSSTRGFSQTDTLDGFGNVLSEQLTSTFTAGKTSRSKTFLLATYRYNELQQLTTFIQYDYNDELTPFITERTDYEWTIHDELVKKCHPDSSRQQYVRDHVANTVHETRQPENETILSTFNQQGQLSRRQRYNLFNADPAIPEEEEVFHYDGLGRLTMHASTVNESLLYKYDAFDRKVSQRGPGSGLKQFDYAAHSTAELVCRTHQNGTLTGERTFDGLDREISSSQPPVQRTNSYTGSSLFGRPASISYKDGRLFTYKHDASLGQTVSRSVAASATPGTELARHTFSHHAQTGLPEKAINGKNDATRHFHFDIWGNMQHETGGHKYLNGISREKYEIHIKSTLRGKPLHTRITLPDPNDRKKKLTVEIRHEYAKTGGGLKQVEYYIEGKLRSRSVITRNGQGQANRIENYAYIFTQIDTDYFAGILLNRTFGAGGNIISANYKSTAEAATDYFSYSLQYDAIRRLKFIDFKFYGLTWSEFYTYTRDGMLQEWRMKGNVSYESEYGLGITRQDFSYTPTGSQESITTTASLDPTIISSYSYTDNGALKEINNVLYHSPDIWAVGRYPYKIVYSHDAEGHVTQEAASIESENDKITEYIFSGEDNISTKKTTQNGVCNQTDYYYDANNRIVKIANTHSGQKLLLSRFYLEDDPIIEVIYPDLTPTQKIYTLFHRINGEVFFISTIDTLNKIQGQPAITTQPCFNQPDGSQIARGSYREKAPEFAPFAKPVLRPYYLLSINGQNAYGYTFSIRDVRCAIHTIYKYAGGKMLPANLVSPRKNAPP